MDSTGSVPSENQASFMRKMCLACNANFDEAYEKCPQCEGTQLVRYGDETIGQVISNKYKILELVGKGGMGNVYLAEVIDRKNTYVAIKMLHAQLSEDKVSVKRFQQEASAASDLQHPNLIQQYDFGMIDEKQPFLVMEYLQGDSLSQYIRENGPLNPVVCLRIFCQIMDGLKYAHDKGVVHRDIKPSNILLIKRAGEEDLVKVLDFGLAKLMPWSGKESQHLTKTGEVFGSPIYMSPEQCMGKKLEPSSDIYSLGITLYEALTGRPPFRGQNVVQTASKHLSESPPPFDIVCPELNLPLNLQNVVFKALEKNEANRYRNMTHFKDNLVYAITGQGKAGPDVAAAMTSEATQPVSKVDLEALKAGAHSLSSLKEAEPEKKKPPVVLIAAGIVALALGAGGLMLMNQSKSAGDKGKSFISLPHKCQGTVYYLAMKRSSRLPKGYIAEVHLQTKSGLVMLTGKVVPTVRQLDNLEIGADWNAGYKGDENAGELENFSAVENGGNADLSGANHTVLYFFENLALEQYQNAFESLSDSYIKKQFSDSAKKFEEKYNKVKFVQGSPGSIDGSVPSSALGDTNPPPQATKVWSCTNDEINILVDKRFFYTGGSGYQTFTLKKAGEFENANLAKWKIDKIEDAEKSDWDAH